ncbi:hypothetical protein NDU88_001239 [Pleurodeles waltl]|uniref:Uncharacterized protein n=1 Tax=Pleurodeles waltl TaxID=8319 RepID=A0AAV7VBB1_PLEWA|nr:hypothetical protein NDU88_001239 [Pleurodeles waltl]
MSPGPTSSAPARLPPAARLLPRVPPQSRSHALPSLLRPRQVDTPPGDAAAAPGAEAAHTPPSSGRQLLRRCCGPRTAVGARGYQAAPFPASSLPLFFPCGGHWVPSLGRGEGRAGQRWASRDRVSHVNGESRRLRGAPGARPRPSFCDSAVGVRGEQRVPWEVSDWIRVPRRAWLGAGETTMERAFRMGSVVFTTGADAPVSWIKDLHAL